ncbi:hypothetical protein HYPSUDRAFT_36476 [Hypholoma sublateritium FD-334 SS-4]|uniref:Uncharacterized protein n=1 Tax=Hypholoma sublateritium (strain FD-334 SS-4) TaxID=945553 RepID=A0A0D2Q3Q0_HYPSF|nr:hypothetical protein HYPSUDRAFT_36476 [Hypholoma sublateritium FD-334 SS-4]
MPPVSPASEALEEYSYMSRSLVGVLVVAIVAEVSMLLSAASPRVLKVIAQTVACAGVLGGSGYGLYLLG